MKQGTCQLRAKTGGRDGGEGRRGAGEFPLHFSLAVDELVSCLLTGDGAGIDDTVVKLLSF